MDKNEINQASFDALLGWLDSDREQAGRRYEKIRRRLIIIFVCRGCHEPEQLADETINRVAFKLPEIIENYEGAPEFYFCNVANKIYLEWCRNNSSQDKFFKLTIDDKTDKQAERECLAHCLKKLSPPDRKIILAYYREEKSAKIQSRLELARKLGIKRRTLQNKASQIRAVLLECVSRCAAGKKNFVRF